MPFPLFIDQGGMMLVKMPARAFFWCKKTERLHLYGAICLFEKMVIGFKGLLNKATGEIWSSKIFRPGM